MSSKTYLGTILVLLSILAIGGTAFIYLIDPYGIFGSPLIDNVNIRKPKAGTRVRISKQYQVERIQPVTLILGNSRPEMGLNPGHICWQKMAKPIYSLTIPGAGMYMQARLFQHAVAVAPIELTLMGVDFIDFLVDENNKSDPTIWPSGKNKLDKTLKVNADR